ncbi:glycosyltransferase [Micromonospora endolithica]|nr:glycosyltransferase [Micromonospora endolithica]
MEYYLGLGRSRQLAEVIGPLIATSTATAVPSDYSAGGIRRFLGNGTALVKVPLGVDVVLPMGPPDLPHTPRSYVAAVSRLDPLAAHKNIASVLECWPDVVRLTPEAGLVLIGSGGQKLQPASYMIRTGGVSDDRRSAIVARSHAFVFPSAIEAFGLAAAEALALGTPVIAMRCGAMPELVVHGANGYLVDAEEVEVHLGDHHGMHLRPNREQLVTALSSLMDEACRAGMRAAAADSVKHLTWRRVLDTYLRLGGIAP